jgi:TPR repeat protein
MRFNSVDELNKNYRSNIIESEGNKSVILNIFDNKLNNIDIDLFLENDTVLFSIGLYYSKVKYDNISAKIFYLLADKYGNKDAAFFLGKIYGYDYVSDINYELAKKYYLMAIEKGNIEVYHYLGLLCKNAKKYELANKYYLMGIEKGNIMAYNNLAIMYVNIFKHYDLAKVYYLMGIEKGNINSMNNLGSYYETVEKNMALAKKYYLMAILKGNNKYSNKFNDFEMKIYLNKDDRDTRIYKNKLKRLSIKMDCSVCLEEKICIPLECTHYLCGECYMQINKTKCPECRMDL